MLGRFFPSRRVYKKMEQIASNSANIVILYVTRRLNYRETQPGSFNQGLRASSELFMKI